MLLSIVKRAGGDDDHPSPAAAVELQGAASTDVRASRGSV
jgi:hypothetical protein